MTHKVALVTGGKQGIGFGIAKRLIADGFAVSILDVWDEPTDVLAELRADAGDDSLVRYVQGSVDNFDDRKRYLDDAVNAWGRLDVLVNNAGVAPKERKDLLEATPESFDRVLNINLRGPYFLTQAFANRVIELRGPLDKLPEPPEQPVATIINMASTSAETVSLNRGEYCISKAGVHMATSLWAVRLAPEGIVVYEVRPGIIATSMTSTVHDKYNTFFANGGAPIGRWGKPADVAGAVAVLASGNTPYSTGDIINVDGGMHIPVL